MQGAQLGAQRHAARGHIGVGVAGAHLVDQRLHLVTALQQRGGNRFGHLQLSAAQAFEQGLDLVRERHHGVAAEQPGGALDGVRGAKRGVQVVGVLGRGLHHQQRGLELVQHVDGFVQEAGAGRGNDLGVVEGAHAGLHRG
jgi:hypothetical protein